jgi:hypothetical protein
MESMEMIAIVPRITGITRIHPTILVSVAIVLASVGSVQSAPEVKRPTCAASSEFRAVDLSIPIQNISASSGKSGLDALKDFGVGVIFRYYDMPNETIPCKTLLPDETDAILAKNLSIGVVFQHNSDDPATFIAGANTARAHALRSLDLAAANGQPSESAISFGGVFSFC